MLFYSVRIVQLNKTESIQLWSNIPVGSNVPVLQNLYLSKREMPSPPTFFKKRPQKKTRYDTWWGISYPTGKMKVCWKGITMYNDLKISPFAINSKCMDGEI